MQNCNSEHVFYAQIFYSFILIIINVAHLQRDLQINVNNIMSMIAMQNGQYTIMDNIVWLSWMKLILTWVRFWCIRVFWLLRLAIANNVLEHIFK